MVVNVDINLFRPMLSAKLPCAEKNVPTQEEVIADLKRLDWSRGFWASPKMDGVRAVKSPEGLVSRTLNFIPNHFIQECLAPSIFDGLDGELIAGKPEEMIDYNSSQSAIMTRAGNPYFTFCVFDDVTCPNNRFDWRNIQAKIRIEDIKNEVDLKGMMDIVHLEQTHIHTIDELLAYEETILAKGYEGIMFRDPGSRYKSHPSNRSTFKQQYLIKLKRFVDAEATIIGFEELQRNENEQVRDNLGYAKRSHALAGQVGAGTLGKLLCRGDNGRFAGVEFSVGSGLNETLRDTIWNNRSGNLGHHIKYKYQDAGSQNKPRSPIFLGFRSEIDK